jgi:hypothetical protein
MAHVAVTVEIEQAEIPRSGPTQVLFSLVLGAWSTPDLSTTWSGWAVTMHIDGKAIAQRRVVRKSSALRLQRRIEARLPTPDVMALARRHRMYQALPASTPRRGLPLPEGPTGVPARQDNTHPTAVSTGPQPDPSSPAARISKPNNGQEGARATPLHVESLTSTR